MATIHGVLLLLGDGGCDCRLVEGRLASVVELDAGYWAGRQGCLDGGRDVVGGAQPGDVAEDTLVQAVVEQARCWMQGRAEWGQRKAMEQTGAALEW